MKMRVTPGRLRSNFAAVVAPGINDDAAHGYGAGSTWEIPATGDLYRCRDATAGAAKWTRYSPAFGFSYVAGNWYLPDPGFSSGAGTACTANVIRFHPVTIRQRCTISNLGTWLQTGIAGGNVQFGIYANDPVTQKPTGAALGSTGSVSAAAGAQNINGALSQAVQLEPGQYWLGINVDTTAGGTVVFAAISAAVSSLGWLIGSATQANIQSTAANTRNFWTTNATFNTWPDLTAASFAELQGGNSAVIQYKVSSVP